VQKPAFARRAAVCWEAQNRAVITVSSYSAFDGLEQLIRTALPPAHARGQDTDEERIIEAYCWAQLKRCRYFLEKEAWEVRSWSIKNAEDGKARFLVKRPRLEVQISGR
jgi:hypothetical protein